MARVRRVKHDLRGIEGMLRPQNVLNIIQRSMLDHVQLFYLRLVIVPVFWHGCSPYVSTVAR
jgi:hypothetical protein